jgi:lipid-A-disaccharide synthase-like uncharacterized protein
VAAEAEALRHGFRIRLVRTGFRRAGILFLAFWYLSLIGGVTLLAYAVHLRDPVFILGQATGAFIYLRNLHFRWREQATGT